MSTPQRIVMASATPCRPSCSIVCGARGCASTRRPSPEDRTRPRISAAHRRSQLMTFRTDATPNIKGHPTGDEKGQQMKKAAFRQFQYLTSPEKLATRTIPVPTRRRWTKVRAGQLLPLTVINAAPPVPDKAAWLHAKIAKPVTRRASAPLKTTGPCPYANICEHCDFIAPDSGHHHHQRANSTTSAPHRPMPKPAAGTTRPARHQRVAANLDQHLERLRRDPSTDLPS